MLIVHYEKPLHLLASLHYVHTRTLRVYRRTSGLSSDPIVPSDGDGGIRTVANGV